MEEKNYTGAIPGQHEGAEITAQTEREAASAEEARAIYEHARRSLLDVNNWHTVAGDALARFQLTDAAGKEVAGPPEKGFHFRIDIPGPGSKAGEGYDWVSIEEVAHYDTPDVSSTAIRVRPAPNPTTDNADTAHFYAEAATSTFTVSREGNKVTAAVYDKNIKPNTGASTATDTIRNALAGAAGILSLSKLQWKKLTDGLLEDKA